VTSICWISNFHPLQFIYDRRSNSFDLSKFKSDEELVRKVQSGKGDFYMYEGLGNNIFIETVFGGTTPKIPKQDYIYGDNDLKAAKAYRYQIILKALEVRYGFTTEWQKDYEQWLFEQMVAWGEQSEYLSVQCFSESVWGHAFTNDVIADAALLVTSITLIISYSLVVLGNCSPIHMRAVIALVGIGCVILATLAGYGLSFYFGQFAS